MADTRRLLIEILARRRRRDVDELAAELAAAGGRCDSVWLVKAGVKAARELGFKLRPSRGDAKHFKTIDTLAAYIEARRSQGVGQ
jgi:acyl carrier protein